MAPYPAYDGSEPCREVDPEIYYPSSFNAVRTTTRLMMDSLCNSCTSQQACLMWALHHEREGYWAGTTPEDRHRLRRQMGIRLRVPGISDGDRRAAA